jgi:hypothetical protein
MPSEPVEEVVLTVPEAEVVPEDNVDEVPELPC